jgi:succinoglycan biosynthesis protein ExoA
VHGSDAVSRSPVVTVVVPVRNEARTIGDALKSLAAQDIGPEALEVIIMDGDSTDQTRSVCAGLASEYPWGRFTIDRNEGLTAPYALNGGLQRSTCPWFTRLDARTRMSANYLSCCIQYLERVGDPLQAAAGRFIVEARGTRASAAIAAALSHSLGVGRGYRTIIADEAEVDHHPFAVWPTDAVRRFGGFDEELTRNQDDEFSNRARSQGARIQMLGQASIRYWPRDRFRGLAAQYFQYGLWKSAVGRRRGYFPARSLVPAGTTLITLALPASILRRRPLPLLGILGVYVALGAAASRERRAAGTVSVGWALFLMHFFYGLGVLLGGLRPSLAKGPLGSIRLM